MGQIEQIEELLSALRDLQGDDLYAQAVQRVHALLEADYAFAGDFVPCAEAVEVRAFCAAGELRPPYRYDLAGTPCVKTLANADNACLYLGDVVEHFPHHHRLRELGVSSYIGVPVLNADAVPAGLVVVLYKGMPPQSTIIPLVLELVSTRLSHEIQRREAESRGERELLEMDLGRLKKRLRQSMCVLRLHFSIADQMQVSSTAREELDEAVESVKLVIERSLP